MKAPGVIYELGRKPDPWAPPDWASAGPDGTFGNRFDDPDTVFSTRLVNAPFQCNRRVTRDQNQETQPIESSLLIER